MLKQMIISTAMLPLMAQEGPSFSAVNDAIFQSNKRALIQSQNSSIPPPEEEREYRPNQYQELLTLSMNWGAFSGTLTGRHTNFYKAEPDRTLERPETSLYRVNLKYRSGGLGIQAGDFNATIGKGLALSVIQNDAILEDRSIRGGDLSYQGNWLNFRALAGVATNNLPRLDTPDTPGLYKRWNVMAAEASLNYFRGNRMGVHASRIDNKLDQPAEVPPETDNPRDRREVVSASLSGTNQLDLFDYHLEVGRMTHWDKFVDQNLPWAHDRNIGKAAYANLSFRPGRLLLMAEHRYYLNFEHELNNPPLADRETEKLIKINTRGTRLLAQYAFQQGLTLFANYGKYEEGNLVNDQTYNGTSVYGGFKLEDLFDQITLGLSYGTKNVHADGNYRETKIKGDASYAFLPRWSVEFKYHSKENDRVIEAPYKDRDLSMQLSLSPYGAIYVMQQYVSLASLPGQENNINPFSSHYLYSGGIRINLWKGSFVDVSGGRMRGGEVCAGGQCKTMPAFEGWRVVTSFRF